MLIKRINSESASEKNAMGHWDNVMYSQLQIHTALPEGHCPSCNTETMVLKAEKVGSWRTQHHKHISSPYLEKYIFSQTVKTNCKDSCSPTAFSTKWKRKIKLETIRNSVSCKV